MSVNAGPYAAPPAGRADDDGDLRDLARGAGHDGEHLADRMERDDALGEAGAAGVPDAEDGHTGDQCPLIGHRDRLAAVFAHRTTLDGGVRDERHDRSATHLAGRAQHAAGVLGSDQLERALVEERLKPFARVP